MTEKLKRPYQIVTLVYVALLFSFYLLFFGKNGLAAISAAKAVCYYALTLSYIAAVLFLFALHGAQRKLRWSAIKADLKDTPAASWLILLFLVFTVVSALLSDYDTVWRGGVRHEGVLTISLYCISFLFISRFYRPSRWQLFLFAASVTAFCGVCVLQMLNVNVFGLFPLSAAKPTCESFLHSFIGTIGNVDFAASFLCIAVPIFWCAVLRLNGRLRFILLLPLLLCLLVLVRINVAAGFVGVILGTLLSVPVVLPCGSKTRVMLWIAVAFLLIAGLVAVYFCNFPQKELRQLRSILHGTVKDTYGSGRVFIWRRTLIAVPEHLWFGTGADTMMYAAFARRNILDANGAVQYVKVFDAAHNEYLTILFHQGLLALLSYLSALGVTFVKWWKKARENAGAAIAGTAVLCYCLQAFFSISQLITSPFFWCVFAITVHALHGKTQPEMQRKN